ncbi:tRNA ligase class II core domain protein [Teladorsagia circumcincta]|uniref:tRNA ligase class II core domain protein n=1 Tax=Teladorsagia circumcincta TaxID=45464 RepID=A0A2G9V668_TELCI|nr:tRNA ligase class II core domain protein [Teladorsagia circumcincta]
MLLTYSLLPLGQRVIEKLMRLIDVEMESVGAMKVTMPILGYRGLWEKASRWDSMGSELFRTKDRLGTEWCLQPTAEEMCTELAAQLLPLKNRMFPLLFYQTTDKFRDEMNPRLLPAVVSLLPEGEERICLPAAIAPFSAAVIVTKIPGTKYSKAIGALNNDKSPLEMCCFGIGVSRLLPAVVSLLPEGEERICLPAAIAPFSAAVIVTKPLLHNVITELTLSSLDRLLKGGILLDDRVEDNVGKRIKSLQEIGIPRIVVLGKTTQNTINKVPKMEFIAPPQQNFQLPWESRELSLNELMQVTG